MFSFSLPAVAAIPILQPTKKDFGDMLSERIRNVLILDGERPYVVSMMRGLGVAEGWRVHLVSRVPLAPGRLSRYCSSFHVLPSNLSTDEQYVACIKTIAAEVDANLLLCSDETGIAIAQRNFDELNAIAPLAPIPQRGSFLATCDKNMFAKHCKSHNLPHPKTFLLKELDESKVSSISFPVIVKPSSGGNGRGISRVGDGEGLLAFKRRSEGSGECYLVQEEIPGRDIDCSFLAIGGEIVAATVQQPLCPSSVPFRSAPAIKMVGGSGLPSWRVNLPDH